MKNQRVIDLQLIKPVNGKTNMKGKIALLSLWKEYASELHVPFADSCCSIDNQLLTGAPVKYNIDEQTLEYFNTGEWLSISLGGSGISTANNGLYQPTGDVVRLGGLLVEDTNISGASGTYSLSITQLAGLSLGAIAIGLAASGNISVGALGNLILSGTFVNITSNTDDINIATQLGNVTIKAINDPAGTGLISSTTQDNGSNYFRQTIKSNELSFEVGNSGTLANFKIASFLKLNDYSVNDYEFTIGHPTSGNQIYMRKDLTNNIDIISLGRPFFGEGYVVVDQIQGSVTIAAPNNIYNIIGLQEFANDAAAVLAGLPSGSLYKTTSGGSSVVKVVA